MAFRIRFAGVPDLLLLVFHIQVVVSLVVFRIHVRLKAGKPMIDLHIHQQAERPMVFRIRLAGVPDSPLLVFHIRAAVLLVVFRIHVRLKAGEPMVDLRTHQQAGRPMAFRIRLAALPDLPHPVFHIRPKAGAPMAELLPAFPARPWLVFHYLLTVEAWVRRMALPVCRYSPFSHYPSVCRFQLRVPPASLFAGVAL
jgi:hypothetical protein